MKSRIGFSLAFAGAALLCWSAFAMGHCDGLDGPVVRAAERALETGDVKLVLIWVQKADEAEITVAFEKTFAVRKLGPQARELADRYFFETLVRVHRAGEGEPYTGLKPAGRDLGPAIPAADKALETGSVEPLIKLIADVTQNGLRKRFQEAVAAQKAAGNSVEAGREFVRAYVVFIHYAEKLFRDATVQASEHSGHSQPTPPAHEEH